MYQKIDVKHISFVWTAHYHSISPWIHGYKSFGNLLGNLRKDAFKRSGQISTQYIISFLWNRGFHMISRHFIKSKQNWSSLSYKYQRITTHCIYKDEKCFTRSCQPHTIYTLLVWLVWSSWSNEKTLPFYIKRPWYICRLFDFML